ncbi:MAG TPA: leukotriene A4 hydrolase C-terminal domain-containing protein, partial [Thermoanaerobaculia bacterium]|nr:leukotriene A4 hydrolase C-terminal domain-containing protein [Thermoanaerobaculia bacterium]
MCLAAVGCGGPSATPAPAATPSATAATRTSRDGHSYGNPEEIRVRHANLDWDVLFERKILRGSADLLFERPAGGRATRLVLDTRDLDVQNVETSADGAVWSDAAFSLAPAGKILGSALTVAVPEGATRARVTYATRPQASALQWLDPQQTATRKNPFLFTQSQAIHARSWIPLQDSPQVRITYRARVRTPKNLLAVMSANNDPRVVRDGEYDFEMTQPIPSYLIALAVGDLAALPVSPRTGVWAEPTVVERAAREFSDLEQMIRATEELFGPYRWDRYDVLVLPPSFPFGGMENPRLTFATPTVLAGDKSLVALVAHELAHSWAGNLVTNATWSDFWLNEGITTYIERRIIERVYGVRRAEMEAVLGRQDLEKEMADLPDKDEVLHVDLAGRDPDDGFTDVPYEKGALLMRLLEETFGRQQFDRFLRSYFDHFAFQSITTEDFVRYLKSNLFDASPELAARIPLEEWIERPGLPAGAPRSRSQAFVAVEAATGRWLERKAPASALDTRAWSTQEWLHFLRALPLPLDRDRMAELDRAFALTASGNSEITNQWLSIAIASR